MTPPPPPPPRGRGRRGDDELEHVVRRSRQRRARTKGKRKRRTTLIFVTLLVIVLAVIASGVGAVARFRSDCNLNDLKAVQIGENSFVYAANGSLLGAIPAERNRTPVALWRVSPWMSKATVAIEDHRFYEHGGVDYEGIARAAWKDLSAGHVVQGGSTITQQLVRNLYISKERTLKRKLKEACLAIRLSRARSKDWILGQYMNQVYYGNHAYGIEAAAQTYFSKDARDLTLVESALLAGLPQAPSVFDPLHRPAAARARRVQVLRAMRDYGDIGEARYLHAVSQKNLKLKPGRLYTRIREPYFFSYVRDQLIDEYGAGTVRSGGLRVFTTINPRLQVAARKAITDTLYLRDDPAAAVVSINPASGAIRAMTAVTPGRTGNQFNLVAQARRQPGSTFKTFVLAAAINEGMNPDSTYYTSAPFHYQPDPYTPAWDVQTYDHSYSGSVSVHSATLASDNTVYAQLTLDVTPDKVAEMARKLGVRSHLDVVPAMGLGADAISPLEEASAYATLAAGGIYSQPMAIRKVVLANGKEDTDAGWGRPRRERVISDGVAYEVTKILEDNVLEGTGVGAYFGRPAAGKTGTTDNHADAWFSGFVPQLETTVWVGYPQGEIPMENVHGIAVAGGTFPATIWKLFMETAMDRAPALNWSEPRDPVVWRAFTQGQYGSSLRPTNTYYYNSPTTTAGQTTTGQAPPPPPPPSPRSGTRTVITTPPPPPPPVEPPPPPPPPPPEPPPPPPPGP
jgi:penicillin-binding protein 1A